MGNFTLVLGGARSGKSTYAEQLASSEGGSAVMYVATAQAWDDEMRLRIQQHQNERPANWLTVEAPRDIAAAITAAHSDQSVILIDCITMLVSNILLEFDDPFCEEAAAMLDQEIASLLEVVVSFRGQTIAVSNEVGMGLVPPYPLGRAYRDLLGKVNQHLAKHAAVVKLLIAGIPIQVKG